jgi:hypothetical protein
MRRPFGVVLASFVLFANLSKPQKTNSQSLESGAASKAGAETAIISLLQQSHDIGQQLPLSQRLTLLPRQTWMVSKLRNDLGREWANELFTISFPTKGDQRSWVQSTAMGVLVRLDPDRALELLHSMSMEEPEAYGGSSPAKMRLAQLVFQVLVERDGASVLPLLEQEAQAMGNEGHYPYAALGYAAMQATSKDWGKDNQRAIRLLQSVFDPAFARYSQSPQRYSDDLEFGRMLDVLSGGLPFDSVQPALRLLVKNLLATDTRKYQFVAGVHTSDGKTAKADNAIDAAILVYGMLINRDPELVQELESRRPALKTLLEYTKEGRHSSIEGPVRPEVMQSEDSADEIRMDAIALSRSSPEAAIAKVQELPDDDWRTSTMLEVARGVAGDRPERAAELIAETQHNNQPTDDEMHFNLISAQASVAGSQNKQAVLRDLLQRGFESANHILLEQQRTGEIHFFAGLGPLIQVGMQNDPELTTSFIDSLPASYLKAHILLGAASALSMGRRLPLSNRPQ